MFFPAAQPDAYNRLESGRFRTSAIKLSRHGTVTGLKLKWGVFDYHPRRRSPPGPDDAVRPPNAPLHRLIAQATHKRNTLKGDSNSIPEANILKEVWK